MLRSLSVVLNMFGCHLLLLAVIFTGHTFEAYRMLTLEDDSICSPIEAKRKIKLEAEDKSGIIVSIRTLRNHPLAWQYSFNCKFYVEAKQSDSGIFAVIQNLDFRRNNVSNTCIDYVQYKRHDGTSSQQYCGRINAAVSMDHIFALEGAEESQLEPTSNSFVDRTRQIRVHVYVSKEPLAADEDRELSIVFTSFRDCKQAKLSDLPCLSKPTCIYEEFFNDGYINCPYPDCADEEGCSDMVQTEKKYSVGSKVIIGSVSTLIIVFAVFIICIWQCRKYHILCWAESFANPQTSQSHTMELGRQPELQVPTTVPTALAPQPTTPDEEKDLPPSYESLFPER